MGVDLQTDRGSFACMDFGGSGPDCLLIHGTGQNAMAWQSFAKAIGHELRVAAFDMRGHGQTLELSTNAEQYWQDIEAVAAALAMEEPILIGHSTGAYAAAAFVASGGRASRLVCVEGFTLDGDAEARAAARDGSSNRASRELFDMFRYGWRATEAERDAYIEEVVAAAPDDWLNEGVEANLLRAMLQRCFVHYGNRWLRRPTLDEIGIVSAPDAGATIFPSREIYDRITIPMLLVGRWRPFGRPVPGPLPNCGRGAQSPADRHARKPQSSYAAAGQAGPVDCVAFIVRRGFCSGMVSRRRRNAAGSG